MCPEPCEDVGTDRSPGSDRDFVRTVQDFSYAMAALTHAHDATLVRFRPTAMDSVQNFCVLSSVRYEETRRVFYFGYANH